MSKIKKIDFEKASELSLEECIRSRLSKIKKNHPELSEKEQKKLAKQRCETRPKGDLTVDYPVQGYTRGGKPVKAHERGEKKQEVLAKVEFLKTQEPSEIIESKEERLPLSERVIGLLERKIARHERWIGMYYDEFMDLSDRSKIVELSESKKDRQRELLELIDTLKEENIILESSIQSWKPPITFTSLGLKRKSLDLIGIHVTPIVSKTITPVIARIDSIPFSEFTQLKTDFETTDFVVFHGPIARDGPYLYQDKNGRAITLHKTLPNLVDIYSRYDYLPIRPAINIGAHYAEEMGYGTNFCLNEETNMIEADLVLVNDDKFKEILRNQGEYHVSPGYTDIVKNNVQTITGLDHIAIAFGEEISRACTGTNEKGSSCTKVKQKYHDQNLTEVVNN